TTPPDTQNRESCNLIGQDAQPPCGQPRSLHHQPLPAHSHRRGKHTHDPHQRRQTLGPHRHQHLRRADHLPRPRPPPKPPRPGPHPQPAAPNPPTGAGPGPGPPDHRPPDRTTRRPSTHPPLPPPFPQPPPPPPPAHLTTPTLHRRTPPLPGRPRTPAHNPAGHRLGRGQRRHGPGTPQPSTLGPAIPPRIGGRRTRKRTPDSLLQPHPPTRNNPTGGLPHHT